MDWPVNSFHTDKAFNKGFVKLGHRSCYLHFSRQTVIIVNLECDYSKQFYQVYILHWNKNRQLHGAVLWRCKDNKKHKQKFQMLVFNKYQTHIITGIVYIRTRVFNLNMICVGYLPPDLLSKPKYLVVTGTVSENTTVWKVEKWTDAGCVKSVWARMSFQFCWRLGNKLAGLQFPGKPLSRAA